MRIIETIVKDGETTHIKIESDPIEVERRRELKDSLTAQANRSLRPMKTVETSAPAGRRAA